MAGFIPAVGGSVLPVPTPPSDVELDEPVDPVGKDVVGEVAPLLPPPIAR
jgi:hypothetical protein